MPAWQTNKLVTKGKLVTCYVWTLSLGGLVGISVPAVFGPPSGLGHRGILLVQQQAVLLLGPTHLTCASILQAPKASCQSINTTITGVSHGSCAKKVRPPTGPLPAVCMHERMFAQQSASNCMLLKCLNGLTHIYIYTTSCLPATCTT